METRKPVVAGRFYPGNKTTLAGNLRTMLASRGTPPRPALGVLVPHAGYIYSGPVAGRVFASITVPQRAVLLGPSHHGGSAPGAIWGSGDWETPLGKARIDSGIAREIARAVPELREDPMAHLPEHSLEVEVPFLQALNPGITLVPILFTNAGYETLFSIGKKMGAALKTHVPPPLLVASSDMNHYEPHQVTMDKDQLALDALLAMDSERLWNAVRDNDISMCGVMPAVVMLEALKEMGATKAELIEHTTSGVVSGDMGHTVGYAGMIFS